MVRSINFVILILLISYLPLIDSTSAQSFIPSVELECEAINPSGSLQIDVGPGSTASDYADCTVSNPNAYQEKIEITITSNLSSSAPGDITVGPNSEADFRVAIQANIGMKMNNYDLNIHAQVVEASGVPPPTTADAESNLIIQILQYSGVSVESVEPIIYIGSGSDSIIEFNVFNLGNSADKFEIGLTDESRDILENKGFQTSMPSQYQEINYQNAPEMVQALIRAPSDGSEWPINSMGLHEMSFTATFFATSDFSCKYEYVCNSASVDQTIVVYQEVSEPEKIFSGTSEDQSLVYAGGGGAVLLLLILFVAMKRRK